MTDERDRTELLIEAVLPALVGRLRASRLAEIEVAGEGWRVRLRRDAAAGAPAADGGGPVDGGEAAPSGPHHSVARSPGVGYFSPGPDMSVGRRVQAGELIGLVEVLGIAQDVPVPEDGVISRVLAEAGQAVEYGQVLVEIDSLASDVPPAQGMQPGAEPGP